MSAASAFASSCCCYGEAAYYDTQDIGKVLEWYCEFDTIRPLLQKHLQFSDSILVLGLGTSALHEKLYESGYRGITCVDFSSRVLQHWRQHSADAGYNSIKYQLADIVQGLPFEHYPYNAIVDKGTVDCILCRETGQQDALQALTVVFNNLKNPGTFITLSHSPPEVRLPLLQHAAWDSIQVKVIASPELSKLAAGEAMVMVREYSAAIQVPDHSVYVYVCKKPY